MKYAVVLPFLLIACLSVSPIDVALSIDGKVSGEYYFNSMFPRQLQLIFNNHSPSGISGRWSLGECAGDFSVSGSSSRTIQAGCTFSSGDRRLTLKTTIAGETYEHGTFHVYTKGIKVTNQSAVRKPGVIELSLLVLRDPAGDVDIQCTSGNQLSMQTTTINAQGIVNVSIPSTCLATDSINCTAVVEGGISHQITFSTNRDPSCCTGTYWSETGRCSVTCDADAGCEGLLPKELPCDNDCLTRPEVLKVYLVRESDAGAACSENFKNFSVPPDQLQSCAMYNVIVESPLDCREGCRFILNNYVYDLSLSTPELQLFCPGYPFITSNIPSPNQVIVNLTKGEKKLHNTVDLSILSPTPCRKEGEQCKAGECNQVSALACVSGYCRSSCVNLTVSGVCDSRCGAARQCNSMKPGTDIGSHACTHTCQQTERVLNLTYTLRQCMGSTTNCVPPSNNTLLYGAFLLLDYQLSDDGPLEGKMEIFVDKNRTFSNSSSGGSHIIDLTEGMHSLTIVASHPDFVDVTKELNVTVKREGTLSATLLPEQYVSKPQKSVEFILSLRSISPLSTPVSVRTSIPTDLPSTIMVPANAASSYRFHMISPEKIGSYNVWVNLLSPTMNATASAYLVVEPVDVADVRLLPTLTDDYLNVTVLNNGTIPVTYNITSCTKSATIRLEPSTSAQLEVGELKSTCHICAAFSNTTRCIDVQPLSFSFTLPDIDAEVGNTTQMIFNSTATVAGTIRVRSKPVSPWFPEFICASTCTHILEFVPDATGDYEFEFEVSWPEKGLYSTHVMKVHVRPKVIDISKDVTEINAQLEKLKVKKDLLELKGISSPAGERLLADAEKKVPVTLDDVAQVRGMLEEAGRYFDFALKTQPPKPKTSLLNIVIGVLTLLVGLVALLFTFRHEKLEYAPAGQFAWKGVVIPKLRREND